jgi:hypothetical protein
MRNEHRNSWSNSITKDVTALQVSGQVVRGARTMLGRDCPARHPLESIGHWDAGFIAPCLPTKSKVPPSGPEWVHEIKAKAGFRTAYDQWLAV